VSLVADVFLKRDLETTKGTKDHEGLGNLEAFVNLGGCG